MVDVSVGTGLSDVRVRHFGAARNFFILEKTMF